MPLKGGRNQDVEELPSGMDPVKCNRSYSERNLATTTTQVGSLGSDQSPPPYRHPPRHGQDMFVKFFTIPRWIGGHRNVRYKDLKKTECLVSESPADLNHPSGLMCENGIRSYKLNKKQAVGVNGGHKRPGFFGHFVKKLSSLSTTNGSYPHGSGNIHTQKRYNNLMSASNCDIRARISTADPQDVHEIFKDKIPAVVGIQNHGNTCFMNAVLQCLSSTDPFSEYFVMDHYQEDLYKKNRSRYKARMKKFGTRGEVTQQLAVLLKALWTCQMYPDISNKFKTLVAKYGDQYEGSNQHDAQEFLLWLLDKVHEDLNSATKRRYHKPKNSDGRPDEQVAAEVLANYMRCNHSFIHDLFQAQFRSTLTCPKCKRQIRTFDPYICLSVPIPQKQKRPVFVNFVSLEGKVRQKKFAFNIDVQATVKELRERISEKVNVPEKQFIILELTKNGFGQAFKDQDPVTMIQDLDEVTALEIPPPKKITQENGEHLFLVWMNRVGAEGERFGHPYVVQVPREATYKEIVKEMVDKMSPILNDNPITENDQKPFRLLVSDCLPHINYLPPDVDHPLYMEYVEQLLTIYDEACSSTPLHLKIILEWEPQSKERMVSSKDYPVLEEESVAHLRKQQSDIITASLTECLQLYFTEEKLEIEDAWWCPVCQRRQQCITKLGLWSCPDILIIHLKRFRQSSNKRTKLTTMVEVPLSGLDLSPYMAQRNPDLHSSLQNGGISMWTWSPWKRPRASHFHRVEDSTYDLYAVCNHHGNMQGGHYTAYCKNPVDGHWYLYDDTKVKSVEESEVNTSDAYILFFQRSSSSSSCASSSTSGYSSASSGSFPSYEHWIFRMPPFYHYSTNTSQSHDNLFDSDSPAEPPPMKPEKVQSPFDRNQRKYSTISSLPSMKKETPTRIEVEPDRHSDDEFTPEDSPEAPTSPLPENHYWTVTSV